jgi:hypothetical protein
VLLTPLRVVHIFTGDYDRAEVEPPVLPPRHYEAAAAHIHDRAGRPTDWPDPRGVALAWGIRVIPSRVVGNASTDGSAIYYRPALAFDPRLRGLLVWHEIAHCYLRRHEPDATESDAWLLSGACVLSWRTARQMSTEEAAERQQYAPVWFIELRRDFVAWHTLFPFLAAE